MQAIPATAPEARQGKTSAPCSTKRCYALEDENADALQDVLKGTINFNRKIGQNTLDDDTPWSTSSRTEKIPLRDDDFEFPDLLGAAYEWLIKHFADSLGSEGWRVLHPGRGGTHLRRDPRPQRRHDVLRPDGWVGRHADPGATTCANADGDAAEPSLNGQERWAPPGPSAR